MAARRKTGVPDLANHLSAAHPLTGLDQIVRGMVEAGLYLNSIDAAVAEEQPIAVSRVEEPPANHARVRRTNRCATSGGKVSAVVQLPNLEQWMEPHPKPGAHNTRHRMEKPVAARPSRWGYGRARLSGSGRHRASLSCALHDRELRLSHQPQPAIATAEQEQRVKITLALPKPPVQAAATVPARSEDADHLPQRNTFTDAQRGDDRLVRGADGAVVNADDGLASNRASDNHRAAGRGEDGLTRFDNEINTAVPGPPGKCWGSESSLHYGHAAEGPAGGCRQ
jgi:hypothetical protein